MKTSQWFLLLFAAVSLVSAFATMEEGGMPIVFILVALIAWRRNFYSVNSAIRLEEDR
jgi:hypothetical protein